MEIGAIMIFIQIIILIVGFAALVKGADIFVDGSAALARRFKVSSLIIGLTIVAFGTSAPELAVSTTAALKQSNDLALSNVVGSNIFNLLVVLGSCAVFAPVPSSTEVLKRDMPFSLIITALVWMLGGGATFYAAEKSHSTSTNQVIGTIDRVDGIIILALFIGYMFFLIRSAKKHPEPDEEKHDNGSLLKNIVFMLLGIGLIVAGGQAVVNSAKEIAYSFGMSETLVGLTIVAVGTSLPELVTSIVAARKHETGLAVGNVVGSNLFNIMFILGITAVISPVAVSYESTIDILFLILVSALSYIFLITGKELNRWEGLTMIALYVAQVVYAVMR